MQGRGPQPLAAAVVLTFMGSRIEKWPADRRAGMEALFSRVMFKPTAEWKEEIVCLDPAQFGPLDTVLPDGRKIKVQAGADPRTAYADWLISPDNRWFARAAVNRTWAWIFGRGVVHEPDDLRADNLPSVPGLLEYLGKEFSANGYDQKKLIRLILNSRVYQLSPVPKNDSPRAAAMFASYPVRRLEAEVLQDALCQLTGTMEKVTIDDACSFLCHFRNGSLGLFESTRYARDHKALYTFEINGENMSLKWDLHDLHRLQVFDYRDEGPMRGWKSVHVTDGDHPYMGKWWVPGLAIGYEHSFVHQVADFLEAYAKKQPAHPTFRDALETQKVCDAVLQSAKSHQWVNVGG